MKTTVSVNQSGQATVEFIVFGIFVLIPLFFGIYYLAKYSDMKSAANQASRYAAFERSWDPAKTKSDAVIQDEVQVRYFSKHREIGFRDSAAVLVADDALPLWSQANQAKLLANYSDVTLRFSDGADLGGGGVTSSIFGFAAKTLGQPNNPIVRSRVEVSVAEVGHFQAGDPRRFAMKIPSVTAIGGGSWSASGSTQGPNSTCAVVGRVSIGTKLDEITSPIQWLINRLESSELDIGHIKPDIVPEGSLQRDGVIAPWTNVPIESQKSPVC